MTFAITLFIIAISITLFSMYTIFTVKYKEKITNDPVRHTDRVYPLVSILKPLKNMDDEIEKNLESFFHLDYPSYEVLFGVDSLGDPVMDIIEVLQAKYPHIPSFVIETGHSSTENPKIHKLTMLSEKSTGELFWVSDSNIRVEPLTLTKLVNEYLEKDSRIIFSPIRATGSRSIGSIIENAYINHFLSGNVISAWALFKQQIIVGKSMLIERQTLNYFGGFSYFKDHLAEDYVMGETFTTSKFPISTNFTWVTTINSSTTIKGFFSRMERWSQLRYHLKPHYYLLEIFLNPVLLAIFLSLPNDGKKSYIMLLSSFLLKMILEYFNLYHINPTDRRKLKILLLFPFCILLKDIILFLVYFAPFFSRTVNWRGGKITIGKDTLISFSQENLLFDGA